MSPERDGGPTGLTEVAHASRTGYACSTRKERRVRIIEGRPAPVGGSFHFLGLAGHRIKRGQASRLNAPFLWNARASFQALTSPARLVTVTDYNSDSIAPRVER